MSVTPLFSVAALAGGALVGAATKSIGHLSSAFSDLMAPDPEPADAPLPPMMLESLPTTVEGIDESAREALAKFRELIAPKLAELGISTSPSITLTVDSLGNVRETSGHPQAAEIEHLLETNEEAARYFRKASQQFSLARAAREQEQFSQVYTKNPELAVEQYAHLFDDRREQPRFSLQLTGDTAEPLFS